MDQWTSAQQWGAAVAPKPPALISIAVASSVIIRIARSGKSFRRRSYQRIVVGACVSFALQSGALLWGQWAVPAGTAGAVTASGNYHTCAAQGFLLQMFGQMSHIYVTSLCLHGLLSVRCNFTWRWRPMKAFEACTHAAAWLYPFSSATALAANGSFGAAVGAAFCYVEPGTQRFYLCDLPVLLSLTFGAVCMVSLGLTVSHKERDCDHRPVRLQGKRKIKEEARRKKSRMVLKQRFLFFAAMCPAYLCLLSSRILLNAENMSYVPLYIAGLVLLSLQGSLISLIYHLFRAIYRNEESRSDSTIRKSTWTLEASAPQMQVSWSLHNSTPQMRASTQSRASANETKLDQTEFEIYDGTNPSSQWAMFILDDEDSGDEFGYGTADETNCPQGSMEQTEEDTGISENKQRKTSHEEHFCEEDLEQLDSV